MKIQVGFALLALLQLGEVVDAAKTIKELSKVIFFYNGRLMVG
jgi:hypothetical protein